MRVTPLADFDGMEDMVKGWCQNAGPDVTYEYLEVTGFPPKLIFF